jgi:hypothetical protein
MNESGVDLTYDYLIEVAPGDIGNPDFATISADGTQLKLYEIKSKPASIDT